SLSSGVCLTPFFSLRARLSRSVIRVPRPVYSSVRQLAVPPRNPSAVSAAGLLASILARRLLNSARVRSLVQQRGLDPGPDQGTLHFALSSVATMLVVVWRSHSA